MRVVRSWDVRERSQLGYVLLLPRDRVVVDGVELKGHTRINVTFFVWQWQQLHKWRAVTYVCSVKHKPGVMKVETCKGCLQHTKLNEFPQ